MTDPGPPHTGPSRNGVGGGPLVVVAYHAPALLDRCLAELDGGLAVIVVDNSSDGEVAAVAPAQHDPVHHAPARVGWPFPTPSGAWLEAVGLGRLRRRTDFLIGSVLLLADAALTDVGGFDDR